MIQIGAFAHEFGHAFGLPDLYDLREPDESAGIGGWGLMGSGSWGGDGHSHPEKPTHMIEWSKEFLGWVDPVVIEADTAGVEIPAGKVVRVDYSNEADPEDSRYLLMSYRGLSGFDLSLTGSGLLVTEVNNPRVEAGLVNNTVNAEPFEMGINVIEADGKQDLDRGINRGDAGDVFPGSSGTPGSTSPLPKSSPPPRNIRQMPDKIAPTSTSRTTCPEHIAEAAVSPSAVAAGDGRRTGGGRRGTPRQRGQQLLLRSSVRREGRGRRDIAVSPPVSLGDCPTSRIRRTPPAHAWARPLGHPRQEGRRARNHRPAGAKGAGPTDVLTIEEFEPPSRASVAAQRANPGPAGWRRRWPRVGTNRRLRPAVRMALAAGPDHPHLGRSRPSRSTRCPPPAWPLPTVISRRCTAPPERTSIQAPTASRFAPSWRARRRPSRRSVVRCARARRAGAAVYHHDVDQSVEIEVGQRRAAGGAQASAPPPRRPPRRSAGGAPQQQVVRIGHREVGHRQRCPWR